ncbi:hypothetical protein [Lysobacter enzymogenes]|uniref:hypothetical protein n=1 Tax=Lysobacter enzymogenes TaxID=69 RepID=UPI001A97AA04|nr:hypothetical protein [Lysobacter enzymogenes]QQP98429.1 hypothetical protein JHW38_10800 [Lysobacter enzymogenes]
MRNMYSALLFALPLQLLAIGSIKAFDADDRVVVVGALHGLHDREPAFGYERLRSAIADFRPDVLVLEVRPDELAEKKPTPGRPEYPAVIWPLLAQMRVNTVAMEPGGDLYKEITGQAGAAFATLKQRNPAGAAVLARLDEATDEALLAYWQQPGQIQDEKTAAMAHGLQSAQFALAGPEFAAAQARWEGYMASQVRKAVRDHPGQRVMVVGSYRNRAMLERVAREEAPQRVVDAGAWVGKVAAAAAAGAN